MQKIIFILFYLFTGTIAFAQTITRLDDSRIPAKELDKKIAELMNNASVTGMAVSIFNDGKPVYDKVFGYKNTETKAPLQVSTIF